MDVWGGTKFLTDADWNLRSFNWFPRSLSGPASKLSGPALVIKEYLPCIHCLTCIKSKTIYIRFTISNRRCSNITAELLERNRDNGVNKKYLNEIVAEFKDTGSVRIRKRIPSKWNSVKQSYGGSCIETDTPIIYINLNVHQSLNIILRLLTN